MGRAVADTIASPFAVGTFPWNNLFFSWLSCVPSSGSTEKESSEEEAGVEVVCAEDILHGCLFRKIYSICRRENPFWRVGQILIRVPHFFELMVKCVCGKSEKAGVSALRCERVVN